MFDEAHRVKNDLTKMYTALVTVSTPSRMRKILDLQSDIKWMLLMTGTPVQNHLAELYALLQLVDSSKFPGQRQEEFVQKYRNTKDPQGFEILHAFYRIRAFSRREFPHSLLRVLPPAYKGPGVQGSSEVLRGEALPRLDRHAEGAVQGHSQRQSTYASPL